MVPCPKRGLIHRRRVMLLMKQALYPQATTAGSYGDSLVFGTAVEIKLKCLPGTAELLIILFLK